MVRERKILHGNSNQEPTSRQSLVATPTPRLIQTLTPPLISSKQPTSAEDISHSHSIKRSSELIERQSQPKIIQEAGESGAPSSDGRAQNDRPLAQGPILTLPQLASNTAAQRVAKAQASNKLATPSTQKYGVGPTSPSRIGSREKGGRELPYERDTAFEEDIHREMRRRGKDFFLDVVVEKLYHVSLNKFGGIKKLMKSFRKTSDDVINYREFTDNFQKWGLYSEFSPVEVDLLFDRLMEHKDLQPAANKNGNTFQFSKFKTKAQSALSHTSSEDQERHIDVSNNVDDAETTLPVQSIIECVQKVEMKDSDTYRDQKMLAKFLMDEVAKRRAQDGRGIRPIVTKATSPTNNDAVHPDKQVKVAKDATKAATSSDNTEYDVSPVTQFAPMSSRNQPMKLSLKEIDETIDEVLNTTSAVSLDPDERNRNKFARYIRLTNTKLNMIPWFQMRESELELMHKNDANLKNLLSDPNLATRRGELLSKHRDRQHLMITENNLLHTNRSSSVSDIATRKNPSRLSKTADNPYMFESLTSRDSRRSQSQGNASTARSDAFSLNETLSNNGKTNRSTNREEHHENPIQYYDIDPMPPKFTFQNFKRFIETGSDIFPIDDSNQSQTMKGCKRYIRPKQTSSETLGLSMGYKDDTVEGIHRQRSVTADYFAPPTSNDHKSDAMQSFLIREQKRNFKYQQGLQNQLISAERIELDAINKKYKELKRCEIRNKRMMEYKSNILINDLQSYKQSSSTLLTKKPNFHLMERMLYQSEILPRVQEDRDFTTTANASFRSSI